MLRCCVSLYLNRCRCWSEWRRAGCVCVWGWGLMGRALMIKSLLNGAFSHALYCGSSRYGLWCVLCYIRLSCFMQTQTCWSVWSRSAQATRKRSVWRSRQDVRRGCGAAAACLIVAFSVDSVISYVGSSSMPESWFNPPHELVFSKRCNFCAVPTCSHVSVVKNQFFPFFFLSSWRVRLLHLNWSHYLSNEICSKHVFFFN